MGSAGFEEKNKKIRKYWVRGSNEMSSQVEILGVRPRDDHRYVGEPNFGMGFPKDQRQLLRRIEA